MSEKASKEIVYIHNKIIFHFYSSNKSREKRERKTKNQPNKKIK